ncbi:MAG TPA: NAD(P)/FAD-dependent oxidoreductase [Solirubrobacteraceae bacterium]|nr:NAD(P)/FAD-dependent oxidoreductase [Solirubrobacteraceae bacterium]
MSWATRMFAAHAQAAQRGIPVEELLGARRERAGARVHDAPTAYTRRGLLLGGAGALAGAALAARPARSLAASTTAAARRGASAGRRAADSPRIAIVGAGLAGLRCAHMLWLKAPGAPLAATVYEANPERAGGRCWTLRDFFDAGLITEHGGAFINSNQFPIRRLAASLGLELEVVDGGDLPHGEEAFWIDGAHYTEAQACADWASVGFHAFRTAGREMRSPVGQARLDSMSVPEWLDSTEIGSSSRLGRLLMANTVSENGGSPEEQSALDVIELTVKSPRKPLELLPGDDEKFHIVGGNDQLVSRMIAQLPPETVRHGYQLVALRENSDLTITLVFATGTASSEVVADLVVLALPFSTLRDVDLSQSGFSPIKRTVIDTLGMGSNAKIHLELQRKTWPALGYAGAAYGEWDGFCNAWDDSVAQGPDASPALLLAFPGGARGKTGLTGQAHGIAPQADVDWFLGEIEPVYPGTTAVYTGRAYEDHWALDPWVQGAYSYYRVGQAASYGELAAATEGRVHFAGEHTAGEQQGFLDGAVATGERAARQLMHVLGG